MKRLLSLCLSIILIFSAITCALAEEKVFDHTQFEGKPGYEYKKIDRQYRYEAEYTKNYSNGFRTWGLVAEGAKNEAGSLWMHISSYNTSDGYREVDRVYIMIDDKLYSFEKMAVGQGYSTCTFGNVGYQLIDDLVSFKELTLRITYEGYYSDLDLTPDQLTEIQDWAKTIIKSKFLDFTDKSMASLYDYYFEASVE